MPIACPVVISEPLRDYPLDILNLRTLNGQFAHYPHLDYGSAANQGQDHQGQNLHLRLSAASS